MMLSGNDSFSDRDLLKKTAEGDELAFKQLYEQYHRGVYNYILRLIHDDAAADELLQDVFWAVWRGAANFRYQASVKTWIYRIAHFSAVSFLRKNHLQRQTQLGELDFKWQASEPSPEEIVIEKREIERVLAKLEKLSPNHRSVVELAFVHGFSQSEIAQIMKCPVGTVKSRMSFALKYLLASLGEENG